MRRVFGANARAWRRAQWNSERPSGFIGSVNVDRHISFARVSAPSCQKLSFLATWWRREARVLFSPFFPAVFHLSDSASFPPVHVVRWCSRSKLPIHVTPILQIAARKRVWHSSAPISESVGEGRRVHVREDARQGSAGGEDGPAMCDRGARQRQRGY